MELDLVDAMTVAIEVAQGGRMSVGIEAELHRLRPPEDLAERPQPGLGPVAVLARQRLAQRQVGLEQVVGLERRRLVADVEHRFLGAELCSKRGGA
jgi:hypothetical protein